MHIQATSHGHGEWVQVSGVRATAAGPTCAGGHLRGMEDGWRTRRSTVKSVFAMVGVTAALLAGAGCSFQPHPETGTGGLTPADGGGAVTGHYPSPTPDGLRSAPHGPRGGGGGPPQRTHTRTAVSRHMPRSAGPCRTAHPPHVPRSRRATPPPPRPRQQCRPLHHQTRARRHRSRLGFHPLRQLESCILLLPECRAPHAEQ